MRILLVTNTSNHHKYWAYELYKKYNVVGVCNPNSKPNRKILKRDLIKNGFIFQILKLLSLIYHKFLKKSFSKKLNNNQETFFSEASELYKKIPQSIIYSVDSINSKESIDIAKKLNLDIICFLGGDIVKKDFLSLAKIITLNFHSGVSPFYNGSGTTFSAVADNRPNFCGGTLMSMNERIDGGDILAHYLTPIEEKDDSSRLFLKGIIGSVKLYSIVLDYIIKTNIAPSGYKQERSFRYFTSSDWTIYQDIKLEVFEKSGKMKRYVRDEKVFTYFDKKKSSNFPLYFESLNEILKK